MKYLYSKKLQDLTNTFFGKVSDSNQGASIKWERFDEFTEITDATLHNQYTSETEQFNQGFDLGVKYAQAVFDANVNGKPKPNIYLVCAPETNHYLMGSEDALIQHLQEALAKLDHEQCVCSPAALFMHGCTCETNH